MVRRAKRPFRNDRMTAVGESRHRVDLGRLDHLVPAHVRKNRRQPFGQHALSRSRRADHQDVVSSCRCDLQRPSDILLPFHIREVRQSRLIRLGHGRVSGQNLFFAPKMLQKLLQITDRDHGNILREGRFRRVLFRDEKGSDPRPFGSHRHRQGPGNRAQFSLQREFPDKGAVLRDPLQILRGRENADQQRQVIDRTGLFLVRRGKVHRHTADRKLKTVVFDRSSHTLSGFLDSGVRKSDDIEGRSKTYDAIIRGKNIPDPGIPESFNVLVNELKALALDVRTYTDDKEYIVEDRQSFDTYSEMDESTRASLDGEDAESPSDIFSEGFVEADELGNIKEEDGDFGDDSFDDDGDM